MLIQSYLLDAQCVHPLFRRDAAARYCEQNLGFRPHVPNCHDRLFNCTASIGGEDLEAINVGGVALDLRLEASVAPTGESRLSENTMLTKLWLDSTLSVIINSFRNQV